MPSRCFQETFKYLILMIFITATSLAGCQSLDREETPATDKLETKQQIVTNSLDSGNPAQALKEVRALMEEYPANPEVLNLHGLIQLSLRNNQKAAETLEKAHQIQPENMTYVLNLSSAYIQGGQHSKATRLLNETIKSPAAKSYRYRERLFHNMGLIAELSGDSVRAERWYGRALEENPTNFMTLLKMARILESTHRNRLAIDKLETAKAACARCPEPVEGMVRILVKENKLTAAKAALDGYEKNESLTEDDTRRIVEMKRMIAKSKAR